jgi:hypothetical protein
LFDPGAVEKAIAAMLARRAREVGHAR